MSHEFIVHYSEDDKGKALVVCNNKYMRTIDGIDDFNCLLVQVNGGKQQAMRKLIVHEFIEEVESNSGGQTLEKMRKSKQ